MTATGQSQGPRENHHPQVTPFKTIWLISRPSSVYIDLHGQFFSFQDHLEEKIMNLFRHQRRQMTEKTTRHLICHHHRHRLVFTLMFCAL